MVKLLVNDEKESDIPDTFQDSLRLNGEMQAFKDLKPDARMPIYKPDTLTRYHIRNKKPNPNIRFYLRNPNNDKGIRKH